MLTYESCAGESVTRVGCHVNRPDSEAVVSLCLPVQWFRHRDAAPVRVYGKLVVEVPADDTVHNLSVHVCK